MFTQLALPALAAAALVAAPLSADTVTLTNGDALQGEVIEQTETQTVLQHPVLGRIELAAEQVKAVTLEADAAKETVEPDPETSPVTPAPAVEPPPVERPGGLFHTGVMADWTSTLSAGLLGSSG